MCDHNDDGHLVLACEQRSWQKDKKTTQTGKMTMIIFSQHVGGEAGGGSAEITRAWLDDIHQAGKDHTPSR